MAKETKLEREARYEAESLARYEELKNSYPVRLMDVLARVTKLRSFDLSVTESKHFKMYDRNSSDEYFLTYGFSDFSNDVLQDLTWDVERLEEVQRAENAKAVVLMSALSKLSKEEREVLGV